MRNRDNARKASQVKPADAVHLQNVAFAYRSGHDIFRIADLRIGAGKTIFLHGSSGSGKTTLLSLISGVLTPQAGSVQVLGNELTKMSSAARDTLRGSRMGYIFQGFNLVPYLSVAENIALPCRLHTQRKARIDAPTLDEEVVRLTRRLDIHSHLHESVTRLSTGQQQRVAIARAIIGSPSLIIADEPTSSLDSDRRDAFLQLLTEVVTETSEQHSSATTLLFVSHDRSLATHFNDVIELSTINSRAQPKEPAS